MNWLLLPFCLLSCSTIAYPASDCVTPCGLRLEKGGASWAGWSCAEMAATEGEILTTIQDATRAAPSPDNRLLNACQAFDGTMVILVPEDTWISHADGVTRVGGQSYCERSPKLIEVSAKVSPADGALIHEAVHIAQWCFAGVMTDATEDVAHANWTRAGIRQALSDWGER